MERLKRDKYRMTAKQKIIMRVICEGNRDPDGAIVSWADMDQILERLSYKPSKDSLHFSIRHLIMKGLAEKSDMVVRRGGRRRTLAPTEIGFRLTFPAKPLQYMESDDIVETF